MFDTLRFQLIGRRRARSLSEAEYHDVFLLVRWGVITFRTRGQSITEVTADVVSRSDRTLKLVIPIGTLFAARGAHQNMVCSREVVLRLQPLGAKLIIIRAVCVNAHRPVPGKDDAFGGLRPANEPLCRFLKVATAEGLMTIQAGVWALTDGLDRAQLKARLVRESAAGLRQSITDHDVDSASAILQKLHLKTSIS